MLTRGVAVGYSDEDGRFRGAQVQVIDFEDYSANDWLAISQFTVKENRQMLRADIVLFVNDLPLVVIELKNPIDEKATIWSAFQQLQTYKADIPSLFVFNGLLGISGGVPSVIWRVTESMSLHR